MGATVLIVDDVEDTTNLLKFVLEQESFYVVAIQNSTEVIGFLDHFIPDLILVDILMPNLSGLDLIKQIRALPHFQQIPIVVLSAVADLRREEAVQAGATAILKKPVDTLALPSFLRTLLPVKTEPSRAAQDHP